MAMIAEQRSKFEALVWLWLRLHIRDKLSSGTKNPIENPPQKNRNKFNYKFFHTKGIV